jgi:hypothetical protein
MNTSKTAKLLALSWRERWLLLQAATGLASATLALRLLPFSRVQQLLSPATTRHDHTAEEARPSIESIAAAVRHARQLVPQASCLPQALAGQQLLERYGYGAELRLGAVRGKDGKVEAHAWVVCDEQVVVGDLPDLALYTPLAADTAG